MLLVSRGSTTEEVQDNSQKVQQYRFIETKVYLYGKILNFVKSKIQISKESFTFYNYVYTNT